MVPVGRVSGVVYTVLGSLGIVGFGIPIGVMLILGATTGVRAVFYTIALGMLPLLILSILSFINGNKISKRMLRFGRYAGHLKNRYYCPIKELSSITGQSHRATAKDLEKMIEVGMFPEGHIDEQGVYFMISNKHYQEYLQLQHKAKMKQLEIKTESEDRKSNHLSKEQQAIIDDGRRLIEEIKNINKVIPGEELTYKLERLEQISEKIFEYVESHPEKLPQIKRFTDYFLPTTLKLAETYARLDDQPVQGKNISNSKKEIEETMDTIYDAYEKLLDGLFEDIALDISTDISVLETMFAQEGLSQSNFNFKNEEMEENK